jgi:hypothetical protein
MILHNETIWLISRHLSGGTMADGKLKWSWGKKNLFGDLCNNKQR